MNDVIINKTASIQRCIERVREEYQLAGEQFSKDYSRQDAAILNLTRACEQSIDLANHIIKIKKLGIPNRSSDSFEILENRGIIPEDLSNTMIKMTGFRNTAIHQYQKMNLKIVISIIHNNLDDLLHFTELMMNLA
ncbi:DUF86 domain-containing protein [Oceanispirochaeta sp.]|jgi:uncharacterized protein YutE (UPF0331/DUF86 family)|uniref:type VII toxin-antitoxin system HepT family RNase toxin n=1 Tax=Oceanispirochaeta sp. TaxID=2035350 RepID=UPI0026146B6B|nr:DUF86 domain-containing protein [Oceanispirochaeta sp.]MDA3958643.1 DUF86 domain-containing protein [Oceanispirochaeta sp.]